MKRIRLEDSLDLTARKVVMASLLYYGLDETIVPDPEFDAWCIKLYRLWFRLDPFRQWQLGTRDQIKATGFHVKVTHAAVGGAIAWLGTSRRAIATSDWQWSKRHRVQWLTPENFKWSSTRERVRL